MSPVKQHTEERCWSLFGLTITSPHRFENRLMPASRAPDLWVRLVKESPIGSAWQDVKPVYRSPIMVDRSQHFLDIVKMPNATVLHFSGVVDFFVFPDGIAYEVLNCDYAFMIELHLLGTVLSFWLEQKGWAALHASSVVVDDVAIGFMSQHGGGKTSLAAAMVRAGCPLLSDDVLAVGLDGDTIIARPGYPQMRMWPDQARHFVGLDRFEQVHPRLTKRRVPVGTGMFGAFINETRPLAALYVPERNDRCRDVHFERLEAGPATFGLARHSFLAGIAEAVGVFTNRLDSLSAIAQRVPVRSLHYPDGLDHLPEVVKHIVADVRTQGKTRAEAARPS